MASPQIEDGHLDLANTLVEKFRTYRISGEEWQIIWAVWRKTYCWHKKDDEISLSQFTIDTGMKRPSVIRAIKKLVAKKILASSNKATTYANKYQFNKDFDTWIASSKKATGGSNKATTSSSNIVNQLVAKKLHTKETLTKETISKETISKEIGKTTTFGNPDINKVLEYLKTQIGGTPDGSVKENRQYANLLINRFKKDYPYKPPADLVCSLIDFGLRDSFHQKNITSFKYLFYNAQKIIASAKSNITNSKLIKI